MALAIGQYCSFAAGDDTLPLNGEWRFSLDRDQSGLQDSWFHRDLSETISLPGVLQASGFGDEISTNTPWVLSLYDRNWFLREDYLTYTKPGQVKVPFVCQPPRHYLGVAWYQRDVEIPEKWAGRRLVLFLERPRWETMVWWGDMLVGTNDSLCAPHEYDLGLAQPGKRKLTIRVKNSMLMPYRPDAHAVSDSLGSTWNGITGAIELRSTPKVWIDDARVFPDANKKTARVQIHIGNVTGKPGSGTLKVGEANLPVNWDTTGGQAEIEVQLGRKAQLWDEFNPVLQRLQVRLEGPDAGHQVELSFGLREIKTSGRTLLLNGNTIYLRGTHHGGDFPLTGYPPSDVDYWRKLFRTCKDWGLNHVRFHSFCPPEAAFAAADELGVYLQPECGMWNTFDPGSPMEAMLYRESERIIRAYGNHPSFVMLSPSNEPKGRWKNVLPAWAAHFRKLDARRLYSSGTGFTDADAPGPLDQVDYVTTARFRALRIRGASGWFGHDYSRSLRGVSVPVIAHELGQWCAYPDFSVISKFTGYARPGNFEIFRDSAAAHGLLAMNPEFANASGRFQLACYKEELEANLRTRGLSGFQLLDLHDYTGQGTALVGLLDPFWQEKGYVKPGEFRQFCCPTVPLVWLRQRVFAADQRLEVPVEIAHYGQMPLKRARVLWSVTDLSGRIIREGSLDRRTIAAGTNTPVGVINVDLAKLAAPGEYRLKVAVKGTEFENTWNFWVYPEATAQTESEDVLVTSSWTDAEARLASGGKVLFLPQKSDLYWDSPPLDSVPVFWNRYMSPGWSRMLGIWCNTNHPALSGFPTEVNCDWQWTELLRGTRAINLDRLPPQLAPVVQAIDDWNRNWKLGLVFECRVGTGRLVVSAIDLSFDLEARPVARQLRDSLLTYMQSDRFNPPVKLAAEEVRNLWFDSLVMQDLGARAQATGSDAWALVDGDPNTYWSAGSSRSREEAARHPYLIGIEFAAPVKISGLVLMNRQNDRDHRGDIRGYRVEASGDGEEWSEVASGELASTWNPQQVVFAQPVTARQLRFTALSGFGGDNSAALAELAVLRTEAGVLGEGRDVEYKRVRSTATDVDEGGSESPAPGPEPVAPQSP